MWSPWMLLAAPAACVVDVGGHAVWLPYLTYRGSLFHRPLLRTLSPSIAILVLSDGLAAVLLVVFLGITGSSIIRNITANVGGHAWITWLLIGAPAAWIGGQVIPANTVVNQILGQNVKDGGSSVVKAVLEQPGTMRKAAINAIKASLATYGSARRSARWKAYEDKILRAAETDPVGVAKQLVEAADLLPMPAGTPERFMLQLAALREVIETDDAGAMPETVRQAVKGFVEAARASDILEPVQSSLWADDIKVAP
jgi:hypothetical protein